MIEYVVKVCPECADLKYGKCNTCTPPWLDQACLDYVNTMIELGVEGDTYLRVTGIREAKKAYDLEFEAGREWYSRNS